jgi:hypothetical protein
LASLYSSNAVGCTESCCLLSLILCSFETHASGLEFWTHLKILRRSALFCNSRWGEKRRVYMLVASTGERSTLQAHLNPSQGTKHVDAIPIYLYRTRAPPRKSNYPSATDNDANRHRWNWGACAADSASTTGGDQPSVCSDIQKSECASYASLCDFFSAVVISPNQSGR